MWEIVGDTRTWAAKHHEYIHAQSTFRELHPQASRKQEAAITVIIPQNYVAETRRNMSLATKQLSSKSTREKNTAGISC
jgi:hypothetical protein